MSITATKIQGNVESFSIIEKCSVYKKDREKLDATINALFLSLVPTEQQAECAVIISHAKDRKYLFCRPAEEENITLAMRLLFLKMLKDENDQIHLADESKQKVNADLFLPQMIIDAKPGTEEYGGNGHIAKIMAELNDTSGAVRDPERAKKIINALYRYCNPITFTLHFLHRETSHSEFKQMFCALQEIKNPDTVAKITKIARHFMSDLTTGYFKEDVVMRILRETFPGQLALILDHDWDKKPIFEHFVEMSRKLISDIITRPDMHQSFVENASNRLLDFCRIMSKQTNFIGKEHTEVSDKFKQALSTQFKLRIKQQEECLAHARETLDAKSLTTVIFDIIAEYAIDDKLSKQTEAVMIRAKEDLVPNMLSKDPFGIVEGYLTD